MNTASAPRTPNDDEKLFAIYEEIAKSGDDKVTASDFLLRDLEIAFAMEHIRQSDDLLDVGCGMGYAMKRYAAVTSGRLVGLDYSPIMIDQARRQFIDVLGMHQSRVTFDTGSVVELPYDNEQFDVVTSHRCLMALLSWDRQQAALLEIMRVLRPGGRLILMEGTIQGLNRLNTLRRGVGLEDISADGRDRLFTLKFDETTLVPFLNSLGQVLVRRGFGGYYLISRVVNPLLAAPQSPSYGDPINEVAKVIELAFPNIVDCGHLQAFVIQRSGPQ